MKLYHINIPELFRRSSNKPELVKLMPLECYAATVHIGEGKPIIDWHCVADDKTLELLGITKGEE